MVKKSKSVYEYYVLNCMPLLSMRILKGTGKPASVHFAYLLYSGSFLSDVCTAVGHNGHIFS